MIAGTDDETTTIYLVRHAETTWNAEGRCQGRADAPFTQRGAQQLDQLAESMRAIHLDAAYTSPLQRARRAAEAVLRGRGLIAAQIDDLAELHYGHLQGTLFSEWPADVLASWRSDPWSVSFDGGESLGDVARRGMSVLRRIVDAHPGESVLVSGHGLLNKVLLTELNVAARGDFWRTEQANATFHVTRLTSTALPS